MFYRTTWVLKSAWGSMVILFFAFFRYHPDHKQQETGFVDSQRNRTVSGKFAQIERNGRRVVDSSYPYTSVMLRAQLSQMIVTLVSSSLLSIIYAFGHFLGFSVLCCEYCVLFESMMRIEFFLQKLWVGIQRNFRSTEKKVQRHSQISRLLDVKITLLC